jgi:hypothetical protein
MRNFIRILTYPIRKFRWERRIAARCARLDASHGPGFKHTPLRSFAQRERDRVTA